MQNQKKTKKNMKHTINKQVEELTYEFAGF